MLFKGTEKRSAKDIAQTLDAVGGQLNAFTAKECTCFYSKVLDEHLDLALELLSDMVFNSIFLEQEIEKEKGVVLEEISMYEDSRMMWFMNCFQQIFQISSLGFSNFGNS